MNAPPWLATPENALLVLLSTGHVLGDFLFQTRSMVERKEETWVLSAHAAIVLVVHAALALPFIHWTLRGSSRALVLLLFLAVLHALIDLAKLHAKKRLGGDSVSLFLTDQALHGGAILGIWTLWKIWLGAPLDVEARIIADHHLAPMAATALVATAYVLNGNAAAALIALFLKRFPVGQSAAENAPEAHIRRMGRTIGVLERLLLLSLVLLGHWQGVGWLFAGKTVARFRELDNRAFSEYYLIGTLSSLLFAAATGAVVRLVLTGAL